MNDPTHILREEASFTCRDGFPMPAVLMAPIGQERHPGILLIHEAFGLTDEMERIAAEVAGAGYAVLLPRIFARGSWLGCIRRLMGDLRRGHGRGVDDLIDARTWLADHPRVLADRHAVMGFCMGGGFALLLAKSGLFRVCAPFYGQTPADLAGACPIVASYGERDRITRDDAAELLVQVQRHRIEHDIRIYPGAGHSFMNRPPNRILGWIGPLTPAHAGFEPTAAADAMRRVLLFLGHHLPV